MNLFLKKCFVAFLVMICLDVSAKQAFFASDDRIQISNFGKGILTYSFKTPSQEAVQEWRKSAISEDLISLNLISIPDIVIDQNSNIVSYPFFDISRLPYDIVIDGFNISKTDSEREIWTYYGYKLINDDLDFKPIEDFEFKIIPQLRPPFAKYERSSEEASIVLPKVSFRLARKIFPEKYPYDLLGDNLEAKDFWYQVFNSNVPIVLTEGHKKALSLLSNGVVALSISQNCMGLKTDYDMNELILTVADDLKQIFQFKARTFYISFDHDLNSFVHDLAYSSMIFIAKQAEIYGNKAKIISLSDGTFKGVDDYIYAKGFDDFKRLYDNADDIKQFTDKHPYKLDSMFDDYKHSSVDGWCFNPCKGKCLLRELQKKKI